MEKLINVFKEMGAFELLIGKIDGDEEENSFLHKPCVTNNHLLLKLLLESGFNPNHKNIV